MKMKLRRLQQHYDYLESKKEDVISRWVQLGSVEKHLHKLEVSQLQFKERFGVKIYEYFLGVIKGDKTLGDCPAMREFVKLMVQKEIQPRDVFMICLGLKTVLVNTIRHDISEDQTQLVVEVYQLLDANFSGVLELFSQMRLQKREREQFEELSARHGEELQNILDFQNAYILLINHNTVTMANKNFLRLFGLSEVGELNRLYDNFSFIDAIYVDSRAFNYGEFAQALLYARRGSIVKVKLQLSDAVFMLKVGEIPQSEEFIVSLIEISRYESEVKQLRQQAYTDPLSSLYNKVKFEQVLQQHLQKPPQEREKSMMVIIHLDGFFQHPQLQRESAKEQAVLETARFLNDSTRGMDFLARIGEGKFALLLERIDFDDAYTLCRKLQERYAHLSFQTSRELTLSFALLAIRGDDEREALNDRTYKLLDALEDEGGNTIKDDRYLYAQQKEYEKENIQIVEALTKADKTQVITLVSLYEDILVHIQATPLYAKGRGYVFKLAHKEQNILTGEIYIKSTLFGRHVQASLKETNRFEKTVTLERFHYVEHSPVERKKVRVKPAKPIDAVLMSQNTYTVGILSSLSENMLSIYVEQLRSLKRLKKVKVAFEIATEEESGKPVELVGVVQKVKRVQNSYKLIIALANNRAAMQDLRSFISKRQLEIIREYRSLAEMAL